MNNTKLIDFLGQKHTLSQEQYRELLTTATAEDDTYLHKAARAACEKVYGKRIFYRGLIEISNICKNDCYYCGIRRSNTACERYRLSQQQILSCCEEGYKLGFRTFVLQGGEDGFFTDNLLCEIISKIKRSYSDCAVTLSLGERSKESYRQLKEAGADRYLLRHETIDPTHYGQLHPRQMKHENRLACLQALRECGYQVGCGFMVGSPGQDVGMLVKELMFIEKFRPEMCGIGPFIPHKDTPFGQQKAGSVTLTLRLLSCIRLICPDILLPATTALASLSEDGRIKGIEAGANVVMPNLSPSDVREKYTLYNNKAYAGHESAQQVQQLQQLMQSAGFLLSCERGDIERKM
ncbi:MAG: [Clostridia bacterium]|nr:[FeFe] hydrogenase H-cluster radical SAM maturase HydE [Clostridia bacterium]